MSKSLSYLSEETRKSNRLQMTLQRQHFLPNHLKTPSVTPTGGYCDIELLPWRIIQMCVLFCLGNYMWLGIHWWFGYGAFTSPLISPEDNYCYLTFYYMLSESGHASMTIFSEEYRSKNLTTLWSTNHSMFQWKKKVLRLPRISSNYSVVFLGYFQYRGHYVLVDDINFTTCDACESPILLFIVKRLTLKTAIRVTIYALRWMNTNNDKHKHTIVRTDQTTFTKAFSQNRTTVGQYSGTKIHLPNRHT